MTVWKSEENDQWYVNIDGKNIPFDSQREAERAKKIMSEKTAEQEIVGAIEEILPQLRDVFAKLKTMSELWRVDDIDAAIKAAAADGVDLADMPVAYWVSMGATFTALMAFTETPIAAIGQSPKEVMTRRNWRAFQIPTPEVKQ